MNLREIARALGGEITAGQVSAPGPGHSPRDRSLTVRISASAPDGFVAFSHAGDDFRQCRDHVRAKLGIAPDGWKNSPRDLAPRVEQRRREPLVAQPGDDNRRLAVALWRRRLPPAGTVVETYLQRERGYFGQIPATIGFLPASGAQPAAMIAAFGLADEPECGVLAIADAKVVAVHLTRLSSDAEKIDKITLGRGAAGSPIVVAPPNDLLGLAITEGVEDALSINAATGLGAWAAGSAGLMPTLAPTVPAYIDFVTICADDNAAGQSNARALADGLRERGVNHAIKTLGIL